MSQHDSQSRLRHEVAACTLMLNDAGILGYSGHVSARLGDDTRFLIQSFDQSRAELTPDKLMVSDLDGRAISGPSGERLPAEVHLHCAIYHSRPEVRSVAHFHNDRATVFTIVDGPRQSPKHYRRIMHSSSVRMGKS
jgi:ribulose-5-phosphate 4-epimerase/fuculose-1-phosphate aldolase